MYWRSVPLMFTILVPLCNGVLPPQPALPRLPPPVVLVSEPQASDVSLTSLSAVEVFTCDVVSSSVEVLVGPLVPELWVVALLVAPVAPLVAVDVVPVDEPLAPVVWLEAPVAPVVPVAPVDDECAELEAAELVAPLDVVTVLLDVLVVLVLGATDVVLPLSSLLHAPLTRVRAARATKRLVVL